MPLRISRLRTRPTRLPWHCRGRKLIRPHEQVAEDFFIDTKSVIQFLDDVRGKLYASDDVIAVKRSADRIRHPPTTPVIRADDSPTAGFDMGGQGLDAGFFATGFRDFQVIDDRKFVLPQTMLLPGDGIAHFEVGRTPAQLWELITALVYDPPTLRSSGCSL